MEKKYFSILIIVVLLILGAFTIFTFRDKTPTDYSQVDLKRPLVVGINSWPGYADGITANKGFIENSESIFTKKYGLSVRFVLVEDIDARGKAFAKGGPEGVDIVWTTVDFWANELPNFVDGGIEGRAFFHVDWSRGGDAIVADKSISKIEDLKDKKISLVQFTPSHYLLENALQNSELTNEEKQNIRNNLIFTQDVQTARSVFVTGNTDAAVLWEPDVKQALKREGAHILLSTKDTPNIIADMMVAKQDFIRMHPKTIKAFICGWLDGVEEAKSNPELAARLLVENEPLFADLGIEETKKSLSWVYWPDLKDNVQMFGLNGEQPLFDSIFNDASNIWQSLGVIKSPVETSRAKDDSILKQVYIEGC